MNAVARFVFGFFVCILWTCSSASASPNSGNVFSGRDINLRPGSPEIFKIGVIDRKGAEKGFVVLDENKSLELINLSRNGYYEIVDDPKAKFINNSLIVGIKKSTVEQFRIRFNYDSKNKCIIYEIMSGAIKIEMSESEDEGYPILNISSTNTNTGQELTLNIRDQWFPGIPQKLELYYEGRSYPMIRSEGNIYAAKVYENNLIPDNLKIVINAIQYDCQSLIENKIRVKDKKFLFFDFNNRSNYLKNYYHKINKELNSKTSEYYSFMYYYSSDEYDESSFSIYQKLSDIKMEFMGKSTEERDPGYYISIVKLISQYFTSEVLKELTIVSRYGKDTELEQKIKNHLQNSGSKIQLRMLSYDSL